MNLDKNGFVRLVDVVGNFTKSSEGAQLFAELKKKKQNDPKRFELQYSKKLTDEHLAAETNFTCAMHRFLALNKMRSEWESDLENYDTSDFDVLYDEYHSYVMAAARHIQAYKAQKKKLQAAVIKQDRKLKKISNSPF